MRGWTLAERWRLFRHVMLGNLISVTISHDTANDETEIVFRTRHDR